MNQECMEGVILKAFPFNDHDRILSLFTENEGIIKLCVKGAFLKKKTNGSSSNPLNLVEATFKRGRGEIFSCYEIEVLDHHLKLRENLSLLTCACDLLQTILLTQALEKPAQKLYRLLLIYLKKLPEFPDPLILTTSFQLKTLRHEGLLDSSDLFPMTEEERQLIEVLALCQQISLLIPLTINLDFANKIKHFFTQTIND